MPQTAQVKETAAGNKQNKREKQARASESPDTQQCDIGAVQGTAAIFFFCDCDI